MSEFTIKQEMLLKLMAQREVQALVLKRASSFAWATCGAASYVNTASTFGAAFLVITHAGRYVITNNIEAPRLEREEGLAAQGWTMKVSPWHETGSSISGLTDGLKIGADVLEPGWLDLSADITQLRANLLPEEGERMRALGALCGETIGEASRAVRAGQTEYEIAARLMECTLERGAQPIVVLVAVDERISLYRHPLPTSKRLGRYAMLVLCGRQRGLVASVTRLVHLGRIASGSELARKERANAQIDAAFILGTRVGRTLGEVFRDAQQVYAEMGFADEWRNHHQGGPAGYEPREYLGTPHSQAVVRLGQAYAWNPSIAGCKSEDTILVGPTGNEVLTSTPGWPSLACAYGGQTLARPAILQLV